MCRKHALTTLEVMLRRSESVGQQRDNQEIVSRLQILASKSPTLGR